MIACCRPSVPKFRLGLAQALAVLIAADARRQTLFLPAISGCTVQQAQAPHPV